VIFPVVRVGFGVAVGGLDEKASGINGLIIAKRRWRVKSAEYFPVWPLGE
jgi:hypothetical protein